MCLSKADTILGLHKMAGVISPLLDMRRHALTSSQGAHSLCRRGPGGTQHTRVSVSPCTDDALRPEDGRVGDQEGQLGPLSRPPGSAGEESVQSNGKAESMTACEAAKVTWMLTPPCPMRQSPKRMPYCACSL